MFSSELEDNTSTMFRGNEGALLNMSMHRGKSARGQGRTGARRRRVRARLGIRWNAFAEAEWAQFVAPLLLVVGTEMSYLQTHGARAEAARSTPRRVRSMWSM